MDLNLLGLGALLVSLALLVPLMMPSALRALSAELRGVLESHAAGLEAYGAVWQQSRKKFREMRAQDQLLSEQYAATVNQRKAALAVAQKMKETPTIQ
jgi:hypothetical protein